MRVNFPTWMKEKRKMKRNRWNLITWNSINNSTGLVGKHGREYEENRRRYRSKANRTLVEENWLAIAAIPSCSRYEQWKIGNSVKFHGTNDFSRLRSAFRSSCYPSEEGRRQRFGLRWYVRRVASINEGQWPNCVQNTQCFLNVQPSRALTCIRLLLSSSSSSSVDRDPISGSVCCHVSFSSTSIVIIIIISSNVFHAVRTGEKRRIFVPFTRPGFARRTRRWRWVNARSDSRSTRFADISNDGLLISNWYDWSIRSSRSYRVTFHGSTRFRYDLI